MYYRLQFSNYFESYCAMDRRVAVGSIIAYSDAAQQ